MKKQVFINQYKKPYYSTDILNLTFKKYLNQLKIKVRNLYQLRHSVASTLISQGVDVTYISKMMGHANSSVTLQKYTRFIKQDEQVRLKKIQQISSLI